MDESVKEKIDSMIDYIMKNCLWQFHSRAWDRLRQNEFILLMTSKILCDEPVELKEPFDRCYWVDAVCLADAYRTLFPWLVEMGKEEIRTLMEKLHERLDYLTVNGSLNLELTDQNY